MNDLRYVQGPAELPAIQEQIERLWHKFPASAEFAGLVKRDPNVGELDFSVPAPLRLDAKGSGLTTEITTVALAILTTVASDLTKDALILVWKEYLHPKIQVLLGKDVLKDKP